MKLVTLQAARLGACSGLLLPYLPTCQLACNYTTLSVPGLSTEALISSLVSTPAIKGTKYSADNSRRTIPFTDHLTFQPCHRRDLDARPPVGPRTIARPFTRLDITTVAADALHNRCRLMTTEYGSAGKRDHSCICLVSRPKTCSCCIVLCRVEYCIVHTHTYGSPHQEVASHTTSTDSGQRTLI